MAASSDFAAPAEPATPSSRGRRSRRRFVLSSAALGLVVVGLAVLLALEAVRQSHLESERHNQDAALAAARQVVVNSNSYNYAHLAADVARVRGELTGPLAADFAKNLSALEKDFAAGKLASQANVLDAAVASADPHQATVLVAYDIVETAAGKTTPNSPIHNRLIATMVKVHGTWLAQNFRVG